MTLQKGTLVRTRITALAGFVLALVPLAACAGQQQTETRTYTVADKVDAVAVSSFGGRATVTARTGGGAVRITFIKPSRSVRVDSSGGDVTLRLPRDRYSVDAQGAGGATTVDVPTDAASAHRISVHSDGGAILVTAAG